MVKRKSFDIVPFEPDHLWALDARDQERAGFEAMGGIEAYAKLIPDNALVHTALDEDEVVAIAGITETHPGVGTAWSLLSNRLKPGEPNADWLAVRRAMKMGIQAAFDAGFHRVQTTIAVTYPNADGWMRGLGFSNPQLQEQWGSDRSDHWLYSITKDKDT